MENIKFIKRISIEIPRVQIIVGNCIYYALKNGNRAKIYCYDAGVTAEIINCKEGRVDMVNFPFANYFNPVRCSTGAPSWYQSISGGKWQFQDQYEHVLPTTYDYKRLASAIDTYIIMFEG